jgi:hypothetical protein
MWFQGRWLCPNPYNRPAGIVPLQTLGGLVLGCLAVNVKKQYENHSVKLIS